LDSFLHAVIDATVDLIAQPRVERVNERWVRCLIRLRRSWTFSPKASEESFDSLDCVGSALSLASDVSVESLMGPDYGVVGAQYTPALNCNVLN